MSEWQDSFLVTCTVFMILRRWAEYHSVAFIELVYTCVSWYVQVVVL